MSKTIIPQLPSIDTRLLPVVDTTGLGGVLQKLNPIGGLLDAYSRTLDYRHEIKRIDAELERMRAQAKLAHAYLDNALQERIIALECRQAALKNCLRAYEREQDDRRHNRKDLMKQRTVLISALLSPKLPLEHKQLLAATIGELGEQIAQVDGAAQQSLGVLLQTLSQPPQLPAADATQFLNWQQQGA